MHTSGRLINANLSERGARKGEGVEGVSLPTVGRFFNIHIGQRPISCILLIDYLFLI